jgi:hypothetical protein
MNRWGIILVAALVMTTTSATGASATASAGHSGGCHPDGHCVWGWAQSTNAVPGSGQATCHGYAPGATAIEISCSMDGQSRTIALPGPGGSVTVTSSSGPGPKTVCWVVTAYFAAITGPTHVHTTSGCSQVVV